MAAERTCTLPTGTDVWPSLSLEAWRDTYATLHMWMQVIGKIRLALAPMVSHWWQVTLYVTPRGLTTSPIPYGTRLFQIDFDFLDHQLLIQTAEGGTCSLALAPRSVAEFYRETVAALRSLGIEVWRPGITPANAAEASEHCEIPSPVLLLAPTQRQVSADGSSRGRTGGNFNPATRDTAAYGRRVTFQQLIRQEKT